MGLTQSKWETLTDLVVDNDVPKLRAASTTILTSATVEGRFNQRRLTWLAGQLGRPDVLRYLCLECGVKVNAVPEDE